MGLIDFSNRMGYQPKLRDDLAMLDLYGSLPPLRGNGTWYFVDPTSGSNTSGGTTPDTAVADIQTAYGLCTSGAGDGICVFSAGTTSSGTTSYLDTPLTWSKHGITVVGMAAPTRMFGRARIANVERTTGSITTLSFTATDTISDSASGFLTAGFEVGNYIDVSTNSGTNDGQYVIATVSAGTITITGGTVSTENAATAGASTVKSYNPEMLNITGNNNAFYNIHIGNYSSVAQAVGCLKISGARNYFGNCHFVGAGNATPAATTGAYDLFLNGAQETTFEGCTFGTDTIIRAAANGNIIFDSNAWRSRFYNCDIVSYSATAGKGAIISADATAFDGIHVFSRCRFMNWNPNGISALTSAFIGTKPNSGNILIDSCSLIGWAAWDSVGGNDTLYIANSDATASGAGGIATAP